MSRIEYMQMLGSCLSVQECLSLFHRTKEELEEGTAVWNYELEYVYNEYELTQE